MPCANLDKLAETTAGASPFPHLLCADFIRAERRAEVHSSFPAPPGPGSFPLPSLKNGGAFSELIDDMRGEKMAAILADKLQAPVQDRPTMVTVRGFCRPTDGKIHRDSGGKLITVLLYLNPDWQQNPSAESSDSGGCLRLLRGADDINDYFLETPPADGTLLAFRCDENAWHGHLPFDGPRRSIQLNWVQNHAYRRREATRHFVSAFFKKTRALFSNSHSREGGNLPAL